MEYKILDSDGLEALEKLVALSGYYSPVQLRKLGGIAVGVYHGERLVAGVWGGTTGTRAYLDYLVTDPAYKGYGVRVLAWFARVLKTLGIEEIIFSVKQMNNEAMRISGAFRVDMDGPYYTGTYELGDRDGNTVKHVHDQDREDECGAEAHTSSSG